MSNKILKQIKYTRNSIILFFVFLPKLLYATSHTGGVGPGGGGSLLTNPLTIDSFSGFVEAILNIVVRIGVPIAAIAIIYSGFLFVTAQGNPEKLATAKKAFIYSAIGTAILLGAWIFAQAVGTTITAL